MYGFEFNCPECKNKIVTYDNTKHIGDTTKCNSCSKLVKIPKNVKRIKGEPEIEITYLRKYPALKIISDVLNVIYGILITLGCVGFLYGLILTAEKYPDIPPIVIIPLSVGIILIGIVFKAFSELVILFVNIANDVEEQKEKFKKINKNV